MFVGIVKVSILLFANADVSNVTNLLGITNEFILFPLNVLLPMYSMSSCNINFSML